jgi:hypothetical protein
MVYNIRNMKNLGFNLVIVLIVVLSGGLGYWAITGLDYRKAIVADNSSLSGSTLPSPEEVFYDVPVEPVVEDVVEPVNTVDPEIQEVIDELEDDLIANTIIMKEGSKGTRVGVVQKFLNIYFETNDPVDNIFGAGMKKTVLDFQTSEGLGSDGQTGPATYQKMIDILESN